MQGLGSITDTSHEIGTAQLTSGAEAIPYFEKALQWVDRAMLLDPDNLIMRYNLACALTRSLGDNEKAIELLGPFFERVGPTHIGHVEADPDVDPLRSDPRFQKMVADAKARSGEQSQTAQT